MKKLSLLSSAMVLSVFLMASNGLPGKPKQAHLVNHSTLHAANANTANNRPKSSRAGTLQKVKVGSAGNLLTVLNSSCHQISVDSILNTVFFIHRNDQTAACCTGGNSNVGQYRYDWSKDGGATYTTNLGPLNPLADNVTINGRYPQAMLEYNSALPNADSTYFVYDGSWHNGASPISVWQGNYYGVGQLGGPSSTYTEKRDTINRAEVEIFASMTRANQYHYFNITRAYIQTTTTTDSIYGLVLERGIYDPLTHAMTWTPQVITIHTAHFYDANGNQIGNALFDPTIAFDPTGQYGWILFQADMTEDDRFVMEPQLMHSTDYGATWSAPSQLRLDDLPGMFEPTVISQTGVVASKTIMGSAQVTVDSAGNPHIAAVVGQCDSTTNTYGIYTVNTMNVLYDIYYNPSVAGCSWQANYLARVFGYSNDYTVTSGSDAAVNENNRVQISRSDDGKKIFIFWNDSDSSVVAPLTDANNTNPSPNMFGIGIDMSRRLVTDVKNFTAGDSLVGGTTTTQQQGALHGTLFNTVSQNVLNKTGGVSNIPVIVTEPDYRAAVGSKSSGNPAQFYMCQNINFSQSDFVHRFDNAPPKLVVSGPDTLRIQKGQPYNPPTASASDCVYGTITPVYSSNVPTDANHNTDSVGVFYSNWTATNPANNTASHTQVVIVADVPVAHIAYTKLTGQRFQFRDSSENLPTVHSWTWGDGTANNQNVVIYNKLYTSNGPKMVVLTVSNQYGSDKDTVYVNVTIGINDPEFSKSITVYPNPSNGAVTLEMPSDVTDASLVTVYNALGEVAGEPVALKGNTAKTNLNFSNLESGIYLMKIETASGKTAIKELSIRK